MSLLEVENMRVRYGAYEVLKGVNFALREGEWLMVIGPNGAGKSTIVKAVSQSTPYTGQVLFAGEDVRQMRPSYLARRLGVLMQNHAVGYSFTVEEVVGLGRYAYSRGVFGGKSEEDQARVERALELTGLLAQRHQSVLTLSGGELQRTFLAQVFAQNPRLLLLDEPTNHLDLLYQKQIFALIQDWLREPGRAVLSVVHDLSLARAYGTRALLLSHGRAVADGSIESVFTPENLSEVYGMDVYAWMREMLSQWRA